MCLILFAHQVSKEYPLVLIANRDEFFNRPTQSAHRWERYPGVIAGRDLKGGGTWMGVSKSGRFAAVTNFRDPANVLEEAQSRGSLVIDYLISPKPMLEYLSAAKCRGDQYNGFNLIAWENGKLAYVSNYNDDEPVLVENGIHGLSNAFMDSPWPKVRKGKELLGQHLASGAPDQDGLLEIVHNQVKAPDAELPQTGVNLELERDLSSMFIRTRGYGTRSSSLILLDVAGNLVFAERNYNEDGSIAAESEHTVKQFT